MEHGGISVYRVPALVVTNKPKWQPRMKKWFVHVCSDITSARKKPFESYPPGSAQTSPKNPDPQTKGRRRRKQPKNRPPFFLGRLSRHGRFEVSASWRVGTPENLESRNETKTKRNRNPVGLRNGGLGKWWRFGSGVWWLLVALSRRCVGVLNDFIILTCKNIEILGEMMIPNFDLRIIFADGLKVGSTTNYIGIV